MLNFFWSSTLFFLFQIAKLIENKTNGSLIILCMYVRKFDNFGNKSNSYTTSSYLSLSWLIKQQLLLLKLLTMQLWWIGQFYKVYDLIFALRLTLNEPFFIFFLHTFFYYLLRHSLFYKFVNVILIIKIKIIMIRIPKAIIENTDTCCNNYEVLPSFHSFLFLFFS